MASAASVEDALTGKVFDIVINNAGVTATASAFDLSADSIDQVIDINLKGALHVARTTARSMKDAGVGGSIINVASILGLRVAGQVSAYSASKAGLVQLTKALALEWSRFGIRVNALCPGYIETDHSRFMTGTEIAVDGGHLVSSL